MSAAKQAERADSALGLLQALDARWSNALFRAGSGVPRPVWRALEWGGDGFFWLAVALAQLLAPASSPARRAVWANFVVAWAVDLVLVGTVKGAVRRRRPVYNMSTDHVVVVAVDAYSFPSGHSSRASFVALFAAVCVGGVRPALAAAAAAWALCTALSRALMGRHYLLDVLAGLALGIVTVGVVTRGSFAANGLVLSEGEVAAALAAAARRATAATGWRPLPWLE